MPENSSRPSATVLGVIALCAVIFAQRLLPTEFSAPFIVLLGLSIMAFGKIQRSYLKLVWPLLGVLIIGFMGVFGHESHNILRDIAYALTPIVLIFMGFWMAGNRAMWPFILKVIVVCGFVLAVIHLSTFVFNPGLLSGDLVEVRTAAGPGAGALSVFSLVIGLFQYRLGIGKLFPKLLPRFIAIPVLLASFVLSYSRTEFMVAILLSITLLGVVGKRVNLRFVLYSAVAIVGFGALVLVMPDDGFTRKIANSLMEVSISNYEDMEDINSNWRGFETYRALVSFWEGNILQQILGQGFGALADLGLYQILGGGDLRYIPVFHNGYAYILLKTGLLGLACYVFFYISVLRYAVRYSNSSNIQQRFAARLMLGCVLSLIAVMYVVGGMAEAAEPALTLLLGYLVGRIRQLQSETSRIGIGWNS